MFIRVASLLLLVLWAAPARAQVNYGRMLLACESGLMCRILVEGMEFENRVNLQLKSEGYINAVDYMVEMARFAAPIQQYFPQVWEAQNCPLGNCRSHRRMLTSQESQMLRQFRRSVPECKNEENCG